MKVGDKLYKYESERSWKTIEAEKYVEVWVVGETSRSWVISPFRPRVDYVSEPYIVEGTATKVPKNKPLEFPYYLDWLACEEAMWARAQAHYIGGTVGRLRDPRLLRQIAALIGYQDIARN